MALFPGMVNFNLGPKGNGFAIFPFRRNGSDVAALLQIENRFLFGIPLNGLRGVTAFGQALELFAVPLNFVQVRFAFGIGIEHQVPSIRGPGKIAFRTGQAGHPANAAVNIREINRYFRVLQRTFVLF